VISSDPTAIIGLPLILLTKFLQNCGVEILDDSTNSDHDNE